MLLALTSPNNYFFQKNHFKREWLYKISLCSHYLLSSQMRFPLWLLHKILPPVLHPASIYLLKVNNKSTRIRCEICSKLTIKTPEQRQWRRSSVFIVNFEYILHLLLAFLFLNLNISLPAGNDIFEQSYLFLQLLWFAKLNLSFYPIKIITRDDGAFCENS